MKRFCSRVAGLVLAGILLLTASHQRALAQDVEVSFQTFYDELTPYGQWVNDDEYGNVWVPNEEEGYRPYATRGHWAMTEYGNMWVSDVPWGWACYHYGRWTYNNYYGWVWIPGSEWAPAWVSWRQGEGAYGWAPLGPGYAVGATNYNYPDNYWVFVNTQYLYQPNVYSYYQPRYNHRYLRRTNYITETYVYNNTHSTYYYGPRREAIERETRQPVQVYRVSSVNQPRQIEVRGNEVNVYRPAVNRSTMGTAHPANVIRGNQPVGRPQQITSERGYQTGFRQDMQNHNAAPDNRGVQQNIRQDRYDNPRNGRTDQPGRGVQQQDNHSRPQPGSFRNDQNAPEPYNRPRPQQSPEPYNRPQPQAAPQPQRGDRFNSPQPQSAPQPQRGGDRYNSPQPQRNEPMNRPQAAPQPMNRPQPQAAPQQQQRTPQTTQQAQPAPAANERPGMRGR